VFFKQIFSSCSQIFLQPAAIFKKSRRFQVKIVVAQDFRLVTDFRNLCPEQRNKFGAGASSTQIGGGHLMQMRTMRIAAVMMLATTGLTHAGGFSRGSADTDILYEDGNFNMRAGVTYVNPSRKFTRNDGNPALAGTSYTDAYVVPTAAVKVNINDDLRCAGTMSQPYGGSVSYDFPTASGKMSESFTITEFGATCGYKFDMSKGRFWLLGGVFMESFNYDRANVTPLGPATLELKGNDFGYRIGAAYEIPEIALRAQLMYRAATSYGAEGTLTAPAGLFGLPLPPTTPVPVPALGIGSLPQSMELSLQTGVAPGWLVFGSAKWTGWSDLTTLDVVSATTGGLLSRDKYYWKDGWTVSAGVGHQFNDKWSGAVSLTWDQNVGTGWDLAAQTWSLGTGLSYKDDMGGELKFGGGLSFVSSSAETNYTPAEGGNSAVGSSVAWALGASYKTKW
jgi:long-chain fatty acid transport protein